MEQCWSNCIFQVFASTFIGLRPIFRHFEGVNLKHFLLLKICFNKITKMLKQIKTAIDIYNNWKNLGDNSAAFRGRVEAIMNYRWYLQHCVYSVCLIESMAGFTELWIMFELRRAPRSRVEIGQILPAAIWRGHRPAHIRLLRCRWPFRPAAASSEPLFKSRHGVWEYPCCPRGFYHPLLPGNPVPAWTAAGRSRMLPTGETGLQDRLCFAKR